jgi:4-amino-4-deoxy-L-arabinose transferase-like glycosyltransferase
MNLKKTILTFFCLVFINQASAMFLPYYIPMYAPSTVIISNTTPDKLTRTWLNWLYSQNCSITSSSDVRSNIDYYHDLIKNHYNYLLFKKENYKQLKILKTKAALISSSITLGLWAGTYYVFRKLMQLPRYENSTGHAVIAGSLTVFGFMSFLLSCKFINSLWKLDRVLNRSLRRDEHMLAQFEEYKAASVAQNN